MKQLLAFVACCALLSSLPTSQAAQTPSDRRPPNIVMIYIDDMGWADVEPFLQKNAGYETPNINRLAHDGRTFTNFYVSDSVCSASRAALLTGCYHLRVGILGALGPHAKVGINPNETTLAEICKQQGYATACFGKWHLGHHQKFLPLQHGFDIYYGLPYSNDMWPYHPEVLHLTWEERVKRWPPLPLIEQNEVIDPNVSAEVQAGLTTEYTRRAVNFIADNKDHPFFLYLPHAMVHVPLHVSAKFAGKTARGLFGDVVSEVDWSVGQILSALREHNLAENTLVIFASDNGPWLNYGDHAGSAGPLREGKGTSFDGGTRVPAIMSWPGTIPANTQCDVPAMTIDLLPTIAALIGSTLPEHPIDGKDIWPLITGESQAKSPHEAYYFYLGNQLQAVRMGRWKLHFPHEYRHSEPATAGSEGRPGTMAINKIGLSLFDLATDPSESHDVKEEHPEIVKRIQDLADDMRKDLGDGPDRAPGRRPIGKL